jgi:hypothetical protein
MAKKSFQRVDVRYTSVVCGRWDDFFALRSRQVVRRVGGGGGGGAALYAEPARCSEDCGHLLPASGRVFMT